MGKFAKANPIIFENHLIYPPYGWQKIQNQGVVILWWRVFPVSARFTGDYTGSIAQVEAGGDKIEKIYPQVIR